MNNSTTPLTTLIKDVLNLPSNKTVFNDVTSKNRRRLKIWGWDRNDNLTQEEVDEINSRICHQGWRIFDHGTWKPNGYRPLDYVIRIEQLSPTEILKSFITMVDFNFLSEHGLLYKINNEVLHPLGLALTRSEDGLSSKGCLLAPDLKWEYDDEVHQRNLTKFKAFEKNRKSILIQQLKEER